MSEADFGVVFAPNCIRFERIMPGPIERVWAHLTTPDLLARWFAPGSIEPREGGAVVIRFDLDPDDGGEAGAGIVTCWDPPRRLSFQWGEQSEVTFELSAQGEDVRLVLTEVRIQPSHLTDVAGGWHAFTDALAACLRGADPAPLKAAWRTWPAIYESRRRA